MLLSSWFFLFSFLSVQRVQRRSGLEPADLLYRQAVIRLDRHRFAVGLMNGDAHRLARRQSLQPRHADPVGLLDLVVVLGIGEGQGQDALLLQIGLMNAGEALRDDDLHPQEPRRHGCVLPAAPLAVVFVPDNRRADPLGLVAARGGPPRPWQSRWPAVLRPAAARTSTPCRPRSSSRDAPGRR